MARETTPRAGAAHGHGTGAHRVSGTGARRAGGGTGGMRKLLPLLLGLLLAALLAILLIALIGGGDDNDGDRAGSADGGGSEAGQLSAGSTNLLAPGSGGLSGAAGETATGTGVVVQAVNGNEGFFVGSSTSDRVYVEWGGDVGRDEVSRFQPQEGQRVNLTGPVQAAGPEQIRKLKLSPGEADTVRSQGAFVNANRVSEAQ